MDRVEAVIRESERVRAETSALLADLAALASLDLTTLAIEPAASEFGLGSCDHSASHSLAP